MVPLYLFIVIVVYLPKTIKYSSFHWFFALLFCCYFLFLFYLLFWFFIIYSEFCLFVFFKDFRYIIKLLIWELSVFGGRHLLLWTIFLWIHLLYLIDFSMVCLPFHLILHIFPLIQFPFSHVLLSFHVFVYFLNSPLLLLLSFISLWSERVLLFFNNNINNNK